MDYKTTSYEERIEIIELLEKSGYNIGPMTKHDLYDRRDFSTYPVITYRDGYNYFMVKPYSSDVGTREEFLNKYNLSEKKITYNLTPFKFV